MVMPGSNSEILLREALHALAPLVRAALREGITYPQFAQELKTVFVEAARAELTDKNQKRTDSAISVLSGVHRKDLRTLAASQHGLSRPLSLASQLYTRWLTSPETTDQTGAPLVLPRSAPRAAPAEGAGTDAVPPDGALTAVVPSFEALALAVSKDVHPRTILEELVRLKLVVLNGETVVPQKTSFVPSAGYAEMAAFMAANVGDHAAAATANLAGLSPPFLEQSVFADGLTAESVELLALQARQSWKHMFEDTVALATQRVQRDEELGPHHRMRLGVYFYAEPQLQEPPVKPAPEDSP
jgi:hypothetical protein